MCCKTRNDRAPNAGETAKRRGPMERSGIVTRREVETRIATTM